MERNLYILKTRPFLVRLSCLNKTEPLESNLIAMDTIKNNGDKIIMPTKEQTISKTLFTNKFIFSSIKS